MKLSLLVCFLYLGASSQACDEHTDDLRVAVAQITEAIDLETILATLNDVDIISCIQNYDPQIMKYLHSEEFRTIHNYLWTNPQFLKIVRFVADGGYPEIYEAFNYIYEYLGLPYRVDEHGPIDDALPAVPLASTKSVCNDPEGIKETIFLAIHEDDVVPVLFKLFKSDHCVNEFVAMMRTPEMKQFGNDFMELPEVKNLIKYGKSKDLPVNEILYLLQRN